MKRTLLVLALMACAAVGCRAVGPNCGSPCADPCMGPACRGPQPVGLRANGCCDPCGECAGGGACSDAAGLCGAGCGMVCDKSGLFNRHCGGCDGGYGAGPYDCSPCGSPNWGCNGFHHLSGVPNTCQAACPIANGVQQAGYCCRCGQPGPGCQCGMFCPSGDQDYNFNAGPPVGQTAYPYYTTRGPRDFLLNNPPSIGPY